MIPDELAEKLVSNQLILFIGAGVSMSLGLPSYSNLIKELGGFLDFDGEIFHDFGDYLTLAEYYHLKKEGYGELQPFLREKWKKTDVEVKQSKVHEAIVKLNCKLIYTTNFDGLLEQAHKVWNSKYRTIRSVKDLVDPQEDKTHIIKLHGDLSSPSTMVFTECSYFERLSFESPLDIKLRADSLGKSILFLGYSLSDINIRYLLYRLQKQWDLDPKKELRPKSFIFIGRPNIVQETVLISRGIVPIVAEDENPGKALVTFLELLKYKADQVNLNKATSLSS